MWKISERLFLIIIATFCLTSFGLAIGSLCTPQWTTFRGLFCKTCSLGAASVLMIAVTLMSISVILLILFILKIVSKSVRFTVFLFLVAANMFFFGTLISMFEDYVGYSFMFLVVAHVLGDIASILIAFWFGGCYFTKIIASHWPYGE